MLKFPSSVARPAGIRTWFIIKGSHREERRAGPSNAAPPTIAPYQICLGILFSQREWIGLGQFALVPNTGPFQWLDSARLVDVNDRVELFRQTRLKIMAESFCLGAVNHANRALQPRRSQNVDIVTPFTEVDPKPCQPNFMKELFVAPTQSGPHVFAFGGPA